jgi:Flp pilus assembly protein protease CpaA
MTRGILLVLGLITAAWDWRTRTIPNWLTIPAVLAGLALNRLDGLYGAGAALLIQAPFFAIGMIGGGDVKLMAAAGALLGWREFFVLFLIVSLFQGLGALVLLAVRRGRVDTLPRGPFFLAGVAVYLFIR